jgi:hypothetical protein
MTEIAAQLHTKEEKNKIDPAPVVNALLLLLLLLLFYYCQAREVPREGEAVIS